MYGAKIQSDINISGPIRLINLSVSVLWLITANNQERGISP